MTKMRQPDQIQRWQRARLRGVLWILLPAVAMFASSTPAPNPSSAAPSSASTSPSRTHTTTSAHHTTSKATAHKTAAHKSSARATGKSRSKKGAKKVAKKRGQQIIDDARAREIQEALIREHYLDGEPSGTWDSATQTAMQRFQQDRGWQSKTTPDARALIKLGLGPSHDHLLKPESAMTTSTPAAPAAADPKAAANQAPPENNTQMQ